MTGKISRLYKFTTLMTKNSIIPQEWCRSLEHTFAHSQTLKSGENKISRLFIYGLFVGLFHLEENEKIRRQKLQGVLEYLQQLNVIPENKLELKTFIESLLVENNKTEAIKKIDSMLRGENNIMNLLLKIAETRGPNSSLNDCSAATAHLLLSLAEKFRFNIVIYYYNQIEEKIGYRAQEIDTSENYLTFFVDSSQAYLLWSQAPDSLSTLIDEEEKELIEKGENRLSYSPEKEMFDIASSVSLQTKLLQSLIHKIIQTFKGFLKQKNTLLLRSVGPELAENYEMKFRNEILEIYKESEKLKDASLETTLNDLIQISSEFSERAQQELMGKCLICNTQSTNLNQYTFANPNLPGVCLKCIKNFGFNYEVKYEFDPDSFEFLQGMKKPETEEFFRKNLQLTQIECASCKIRFSSNVILKAPCNHLYCKYCLLVLALNDLALLREKTNRRIKCSQEECKFSNFVELLNTGFSEISIKPIENEIMPKGALSLIKTDVCSGCQKPYENRIECAPLGCTHKLCKDCFGITGQFQSMSCVFCGNNVNYNLVPKAFFGEIEKSSESKEELGPEEELKKEGGAPAKEEMLDPALQEEKELFYVTLLSKGESKIISESIFCDKCKRGGDALRVEGGPENLVKCKACGKMYCNNCKKFSNDSLEVCREHVLSCKDTSIYYSLQFT